MSHRSNILWLFTLLLTVLVPSLTVAAEESVIKVAGWDVYRDPEHPNKTIGFRSFEERTGVKIEFAPLSTLDEILTIAESEEHVDVYLISNEGIEILWNMGLVNPIDLSRVPHYNNLHDSLQYSEWSQFDSKVYAVPWAWGPTGLMYDQDLVTAPTSWNALWNPEYKGKVSMWDDISMV